MTRGNLLSVLNIAEELNAGKATTKFLLKRFQKWLPYDLIDGQPFYPAETIKKLFMIQGKLEMGMLPGDIEKKMDALPAPLPDDLPPSFETPSQNEAVRISNDGITLLKSLFSEIGAKQERIALFHEKRAAVEEKKVEAMNNIARALQEMNALRAGDPVVQQIARKAAPIVAVDETIAKDTEDPDDSSEKLDDLSLLIDTVSREDENAKDHKLTNQQWVLDDLSLLIDNSDYDLETEPSVELDDLSKLIDVLPDEEQPTQALDDLSLLIEQEEIPAIKIDMTPEEDLEKYKAAIMEIIIQFKTDGLTAEQTTIRLNNDKITTLSGKPEWSRKAISQIYNFIESAK